MRTKPYIADEASAGHKLTPYDKQHAVTYLRLLDAAKEGADWREVSRIVLEIDPDQDAERAQRAFESHLARARWLSRYGYRLLLREGWPQPADRPEGEGR